MESMYVQYNASDAAECAEAENKVDQWLFADDEILTETEEMPAAPAAESSGIHYHVVSDGDEQNIEKLVKAAREMVRAVEALNDDGK